MRIYQIDPINDERWARFVGRHPKASVFHTVGWLQALRHTYQYEPLVFTTSSPTGELKNGMLFCRVASWLTGHRLVSLPFSDHCEPLCDSGEELNLLLSYLQTTMERQNLKYLEIRPVNGNIAQMNGTFGFRRAVTYYLHVLNLRRGLDEVLRGLDRDSVQRRIQRAERAGLAEKSGTSGDLLKEFYTLFVMTRGRHHLPPIPYRWFLNLIQFHGQSVEIRVAYNDDTPICAVLTLRYKDTVYYKYGCSDARFNRLGGMPWLLWRAITAAKSNGANAFDMGRTEAENTGLLVFKNHWVPNPVCLVYWRFPDTPSLGAISGWKLNIAKYAFSLMPDRLRTFAGKLIYRHIG